MKYFIINKDLTSHQQIPVTMYAEILTKVSENVEYQKSGLLGKLLIIVKEGVCETAEYSNCLNGEGNFYIVPLHEHFKLHIDNREVYANFCGGQIMFAYDREKLLSQIESYHNKNQQDLNESENRAYDWLEKGDTGLSSLTVCRFYFPKLSTHYKMHNLRNTLPSDSSDFIRIMNFLKEIPELNYKQLQHINYGWKKLVDNWPHITNLIETNNHKEAYAILKGISTASLKPGYY